ncbi:cupin domain-containing protein, partial [Comamonas thiooxydans]|uniref:cupin domain-containing protein n=1 Tax=Comamonas thiooxydans TaxID=363952 RepID=UPI0024467FC3
NLVCLTGSIRIDYGPTLERSITLEQFDMLSVPAGVRHRLVNTTTQVGTVVSVLSIPAEGSYSAVFDLDSTTAISDTALEALGIQLSNERGHDEDLETRVTRFVALVPYKKDLKSSAGIPPEATEMLSAGSVFPLIVPEGHIGRSRTAPMYGNQGLYISIAECAPGDDGPPPHAHSDTQENFLVLSGDWDIYSGLDNEFAVKAKSGDVIAMPNKVMRAFRNLGAQPAQLLVIIQGPDRMSDTVSFSSKIGEELVRRFGPEIIDSYAKIRMTFDAEARLQA